MFADDRFYVLHTAIAYFYIVSIKKPVGDVVGNVCQLVLEMFFLFLSLQIY